MTSIHDIGTAEITTVRNNAAHLSADARATLARLATSPRPWVRLDSRSAAAADELAAARLVDIITHAGTRYAAARDDAGIVLNTYLTETPADATPAERRALSAYRRQAREARS